jgi:hypothetical protein
MIFQKGGIGIVKSDFKTINLCFRMEWVDMDFSTFHFFQKYFLFFGIS